MRKSWLAVCAAVVLVALLGVLFRKRRRRVLPPLQASIRFRRVAP